MMDAWAAQAHRLDDPDFVAALRSHWRRITQQYDETFLMERGYRWDVGLDCWRAPHEPRADELVSLAALEPWFRHGWKRT